MIDGNLSKIPTIAQQHNTTSQIGIANAMPSSNLRVVEPLTRNFPSKEYVQKQNFRTISAKDFAPSIATSAENFLKSYSILAPIYNHNEAKTKYDMISQIGMKSTDIKKEVNVLA